MTSYGKRLSHSSNTYLSHRMFSILMHRSDIWSTHVRTFASNFYHQSVEALGKNSKINQPHMLESLAIWNQRAKFSSPFKFSLFIATETILINNSFLLCAARIYIVGRIITENRKFIHSHTQLKCMKRNWKRKETNTGATHNIYFYFLLLFNTAHNICWITQFFGAHFYYPVCTRHY